MLPSSRSQGKLGSAVNRHLWAWFYVNRKRTALRQFFFWRRGWDSHSSETVRLSSRSKAHGFPTDSEQQAFRSCLPLAGNSRFPTPSQFESHLHSTLLCLRSKQIFNPVQEDRSEATEETFGVFTRGSGLKMAEEVRFELTVGCPTAVFKTAALDHYATPPSGSIHKLA